MKKLQLACIFMACGRSKRFGSNKLLADYHGQPLYEAIFSAFPFELFRQNVVVTRYAEIAVSASLRGCTVAEDYDGPDDAARTIRSGLSALLPGMDGCLFLVCDQPRLSAESVAELVTEFHRNPDAIVALGHNGQRGNPVLFPAVLFQELSTLPPDTPGGKVIRAHPDLLRVVECTDPQELMDADTPEDLANLQ